MNPTIAKYRERLGLQKPDGIPYFSVHRDDLAALLDIAEAADAVVTNWMGSSVSGRFSSAGNARDKLDKIRAALARLNGDKQKEPACA